MEQRGWEQLDFIVVTGDAYIDHPSFGTAIISRVLENAGYKIGIISQPDWKNDNSVKALGNPKYGFLINSGNVDSMVAHYTAAKKKRSEDYYSPGKKAGLRPDRAVTVYSRLVRKVYPDTFISIGGLEASLRRFAHYDYWNDTVMPSLIMDSTADILCFGMSEETIVEICDAVSSGKIPTGIRGTCEIKQDLFGLKNYAECASFENVLLDKAKYAQSVKIQYDEHDYVKGRVVVQKHGDVYVVQNLPAIPLSREKLDLIYDLPFVRKYHPMYESMGGVPGIEEVEFSIIHNRGCFGGCNFCSLAFHQGRFVTSRSNGSVIKEAKKIIKTDGFKGYINDVGGPTANFTRGSCDKQEKFGMCTNRKCLAPSPCPNLITDHREYTSLLRDLSHLDGVKKVFIRSGIRFDYIMADKDDSFFKELVKNHVSGQLKVAPEHCSINVLDAMGKPRFETYKKFSEKFYTLTKSMDKKQYLVPYLMSSHPGSTFNDGIKLAQYLKENRIRPEQVQDFYPTPGTISTAMYYTGINPLDGKKIYSAKTQAEKREQRILLQYYKKEFFPEIRGALIKHGRADLIGFKSECLVPPDDRYKKQIVIKREQDIWKKKDQKGQRKTKGKR